MRNSSEWTEAELDGSRITLQISVNIMNDQHDFIDGWAHTICNIIANSQLFAVMNDVNSWQNMYPIREFCLRELASLAGHRYTVTYHISDKPRDLPHQGLHLKRTKNSLSHDDASLRTSLSLKELINISYLRLKKGRARYSIMQNPLAAFLLADTRYSGRKSPSLLNGVESHLHTNSPVIILESMMHTLFAF